MIVATVLLIVLAACGGNTDDSTDTDAPAEKPAASASPTQAQANTGANALQVGESRKGSAVSTTLVKVDPDYRESDTVENSLGNVWFGMFIRTCITGDMGGDVLNLFWENFVPLTATGSSYPNDDGAYGGFPDRQYPYAKELSSGCREGWIVSEVPKSDKIVQVDYAPDGRTLAEWKLP